jgi:cytidyltransferase-like protein
MILSFGELKAYRHRVAMVDGAFDPLHRGHIEYFRLAADRLEAPLLCNVASDRWVETKHPPLLAEDDRVKVIDAIRYITYTHLSRFDTEAVLAELRPKFYVKGSDWRGRLPAAQETICREHQIEIVYLDSVLDSSSRILEEFCRKTAHK